MRLRVRLILVWVVVSAALARGQFQILDAKTTASLRGIDAVSPRVAWASGTGGTVLLTTDAGANWKKCSVPPHAERLDFRGVQGFDARTAVVMASGKGDQSALFRTTDGCASWTLIFANPDPDGFFDAIRFVDRQVGYLLGDPVAGSFALFATRDAGLHWTRAISSSLTSAGPGIGAFAASNSSLLTAPLQFGTGGPDGPYLYRADGSCMTSASERGLMDCVREGLHFNALRLPVEGTTASAGLFALADAGKRLVAVGGDYAKPDVASGTAAYFDPQAGAWAAATTMPHGYRSAVAYDKATDLWIAVGPNGTDISADDGRNWVAFKPRAQDAPDADREWNAVSLPFVVGSKGRIGRLLPGVLGK
jgi:hypothetical protein